MPTSPRITSHPFFKRDSAEYRNKNQRVQIYDQCGTAPVTAASSSDESTITVNFTNTFIEKPTFTYGFELADTPTSGSWPTGSAFVISWTTEQGTVLPSYIGAIIGVVTTGSDVQQLSLHYSFTGRGISVPATDAGIMSLESI